MLPADRGTSDMLGFRAVSEIDSPQRSFAQPPCTFRLSYPCAHWWQGAR